MTLVGFIFDGADPVYVEGDDAHNGCILFIKFDRFQFYFYKRFVDMAAYNNSPSELNILIQKINADIDSIHDVE